MHSDRKETIATTSSNVVRPRRVWQAWLVLAFMGLPSLGFAVVSGLFNANYAAHFGHDDQERLTWMAASVLITCFVTGLPLAIEILRARVPHLAVAARALWVASMVFSFVAAMGYAALTRGEAIAEAGAELKNRTHQERAIARTEAELATLPRHRPVAVVAAELRKSEVEAGVNCNRIRGRMAQTACAPVLVLRTELAAAVEAKRIVHQLEMQRAEQSASRNMANSANPQADMLSWLAGGLLSPEIWERLLTVFAAALIELSAALGLAITARSVTELLSQPPAPSQAPPPATPAITVQAAMLGPESAFQLWRSASITTQTGGRLTPRTAYAHYEAWVISRKAGDPISYHTFGRRMAEFVGAVGGKLGNSGGRYYGGIALISTEHVTQTAC
jgi:hypothetical protein